MKVETGVIAAAGSGTRMLPLTLGYPKELMPIINQPAIQLIIDEYIEAGLKRIIIITGDNPDPLIRQYRTTALPASGKYKALNNLIDKISRDEIIFKPQSGPCGKWTPLIVVGPHIPADEGFIYAYG